MSRERAKLSYRWQPAVVERLAAAGGRLIRDEGRTNLQSPLLSGLLRAGRQQGRRPAHPGGAFPQTAQLRWVRERPLAGRQLRSPPLPVGAGVLADACGKSLSLTGTLLGGYSSTLFHLLYRFSPEIRTEFGRSEEHRWIARYGFQEFTLGKDDDEAVEDGRVRRRRWSSHETCASECHLGNLLFHDFVWEKVHHPLYESSPKIVCGKTAAS